MLDFTFTVTEKYKASKLDQYCIEFLELNICKKNIYIYFMTMLYVRQ